MKGKFTQAPKGNRLVIFLGVTAALVISGGGGAGGRVRSGVGFVVRPRRASACFLLHAQPEAAP